MWKNYFVDTWARCLCSYCGKLYSGDRIAWLAPPVRLHRHTRESCRYRNQAINRKIKVICDTFLLENDHSRTRRAGTERKQETVTRMSRKAASLMTLLSLKNKIIFETNR